MIKKLNIFTLLLVSFVFLQYCATESPVAVLSSGQVDGASSSAENPPTPISEQVAADLPIKNLVLWVSRVGDYTKTNTCQLELDDSTSSIGLDLKSKGYINATYLGASSRYNLENLISVGLGASKKSRIVAWSKLNLGTGSYTTRTIPCSKPTTVSYNTSTDLFTAQIQLSENSLLNITAHSLDMKNSLQTRCPEYTTFETDYTRPTFNYTELGTSIVLNNLLSSTADYSSLLSTIVVASERFISNTLTDGNYLAPLATAKVARGSNTNISNDLTQINFSFASYLCIAYK